jgi:hypothetical protein
VFVACIVGNRVVQVRKNVYKFVWVCTDLGKVRADFDRFVLWTVSKILVMFITMYHHCHQKPLNSAENFILMACTLL